MRYSKPELPERRSTVPDTRNIFPRKCSSGFSIPRDLRRFAVSRDTITETWPLFPTAFVTMRSGADLKAAVVQLEGIRYTSPTENSTVALPSKFLSTIASGLSGFSSAARATGGLATAQATQHNRNAAPSRRVRVNMSLPFRPRQASGPSNTIVPPREGTLCHKLVTTAAAPCAMPTVLRGHTKYQASSILGMVRSGDRATTGAPIREPRRDNHKKKRSTSPVAEDG